MNILTDEEMKQIHADTFGKGVQSFARAIEAAVLKKLAEHDVEPVACYNPNVDEAEDAFNWYCNTGRSDADYPVALYTETQLIAAQQKAAEACAKLIMDNSHDYGRYEHSETIRNEEWREYL